MININDVDDEFNFEEVPAVKKYFSREFVTLKQEIRDDLEKLDIPEKKKNKLKKRLAFLPEEKQKEYLEELYRSLG